MTVALFAGRVQDVGCDSGCVGEIVVVCYHLRVLGMSCEGWNMVHEYHRRVYLYWECETSSFVWRVRLLHRVLGGMYMFN